jgi:hypothetical protein
MDMDADTCIDMDIFERKMFDVDWSILGWNVISAQ